MALLAAFSARRQGRACDERRFRQGRTRRREPIVFAQCEYMRSGAIIDLGHGSTAAPTNRSAAGGTSTTQPRTFIVAADGLETYSFPTSATSFFFNFVNTQNPIVLVSRVSRYIFGQNELLPPPAADPLAPRIGGFRFCRE